MSNREEYKREAERHEKDAARLRRELKSAQARGDRESTEIIKEELGTAEAQGRWFRRL